MVCKKRLAKRLRAGEFAVIDHSDLDRVAAESLVECRPAAVLNAYAESCPNLKPNSVPRETLSNRRAAANARSTRRSASYPETS